jgi:hypothetical protein
MSHRLGIALIAKGSVNNLHRPDVVEAFRERGVEVTFLTRAGFASALAPLPGCRYVECRFGDEAGALAYRRELCRYLRSLYANERIQLLTRAEKRGWRRRAVYGAFRAAARARGAMRALLALEARLYRGVQVGGPDPAGLDQLLLQSIGGRDSSQEAILTWWARAHGLSVVHMIGNYDHLSSKGYRGAPVDHLLVWGPVMAEDAVRLHGIPPQQIRTIGPVRYDAVLRQTLRDRATFLSAIGLDPARRTILFAGSQAEYHYFEMLQAFEELRAGDDRYQLILRIYPDRVLMSSPYMAPLIGHARGRPGVYVSIGDPHHRATHAGAAAEIEQTELWHALRHADVVLNIHSTIALEACLFDKPAVYVLYQPTRGHGWIRPPEYFDYGQLLHNRRMAGYGALTEARSRPELLRLIQEAVRDPDRHRAARALAVRRELGLLDGRAHWRLADACVEALAQDRGGGAAPGPARTRVDAVRRRGTAPAPSSLS